MKPFNKLIILIMVQRKETLRCESIVSLHGDTWAEWVSEKIDATDYRNQVMTFDHSDKQEINLLGIYQRVAIK